MIFNLNGHVQTEREGWMRKKWIFSLQLWAAVAGSRRVDTEMWAQQGWPYYPQELSKTTDFLQFWHRLANRDYSGVGNDRAHWGRLAAPARSSLKEEWHRDNGEPPRSSPLQRRVLIVLAAPSMQKRPGPVATRDIERVLEQGGDAPVYGPNLRASCRHRPKPRAGCARCASWTCSWPSSWRRTVAALQNRSSGQNARLKRHRQRRTDVRRLPLRQTAAGDAVELQLGDGHYSCGKRPTWSVWTVPPVCSWRMPAEYAG